MQLPIKQWLLPPRRFFAVVGGIMLRPRAFDFYSFGIYLHPLAEIPANTPFKSRPDVINVFHDAQGMAIIFSHDEFCQKYLPSSVAAIEHIDRFIGAGFTVKPDAMPEVVREVDVEVIRQFIQTFETLLQDELGKLPIFCCEDEQIGNLSVDKLLKGGSKGYPQKTRTHLTTLCLSEIDEAGKCLVFERSTAAGFHMLRSVELTIREYLLAVPNFVMPPLNRQNWGEYLKLLKDNNAGKEVTDHLHNIKDNYRNPLMHPEDTLELDEAVSLFGVAQSMNEMLINDMKKRGFIK